MSSADDDPSPLPPFHPARAAAVRRRLGLTLGQVAWAIAAYRGEPLHPDALAAWEAGTVVPDAAHIQALAAALWCSPVDLVGEAATLAQCRAVAGLSTGQVAAALGMTHARWEEAERRNRWRGTADQTRALLHTLRPPPACFVAACGRTGQLRVLLREAVSGWWPNYVSPVSRIVPLPHEVIGHALEQLHLIYQQFEGAVGGSPRAAAAAEAQAADFLDRIDLYLWQQVRAATQAAPGPGSAAS
ncbi:helix-turn-helix domain-containing protein [Streptomyces vietnamensis]|uniref:helix-turn-helix domain-containing protein n=1 Tax=Streptomyces vietnamensis TaxID=362257 RepID=UPI0006980B6B|nr:helix-turn-helix transcriptional regulator [Streptomyces vietnamensis]